MADVATRLRASHNPAIMQFDNRILDDIARAASGALGALGGVRAEFESQFRAGMERLLKSADMVTREEFEAVKAMAAKARNDAEELKARLAAVEAKLAPAPPAGPEPPLQING